MLEPQEVRRWERLTAAMIRHAADDDPEALAQVVAVLRDAEQQLQYAAQKLHEPWCEDDGRQVAGYSWAQIGRALGVSRQAAAKRFGSVA